jgi:succinyl-CoA synthetase alpha subunit
MSILINKNTRVITQGKTGVTGTERLLLIFADIRSN